MDTDESDVPVVFSGVVIGAKTCQHFFVVLDKAVFVTLRRAD